MRYKDQSRKKAKGETFTPIELSNFVAERLLSIKNAKDQKLRILEPSVGDGSLLIALIKKLKLNLDNVSVIAYDINEDGKLDLFWFGMSKNVWGYMGGSHSNGKYFIISDYFNQSPPYQILEYDSSVEFAAGGVNPQDIDGDGRVIELINNHWVFDPDDVNGVDDDDDGYVDNFVGYDPAFGDNDPYPVNSYHQHGTKVAGNVAASTNNGIGLASVGYSVKIMGVNANGNVDEPWFLTHTSQAVLASAQMGADIINCSWVSGYSEAQNNLFQTVYNEYGCITLGAAGNGENNGGPSDTTDFDPRYPAAFDNVISVTAMSPNDNFNCWANAHETVDLSAPGEAIICAMPFDIVNPEQYAIGNGTSYATPMTAGAVALVKSVIPNASNETIISKIVGTTDYFSDMTKVCNGQSVEGMLGSGQLNIYRAILATREPELLVTNIEIQTPDGLVHPGDTVMINFSVGNTPVFLDADNVYKLV